MITFAIINFLLGVLIASYWLTGRVRLYALQTKMLDLPNARSSHTIPTPRGGGMAFACLILGALGCFVFLLPEMHALWWGLLGGGAIVSSVGWLDDRWHLSAKIRLSAHCVAVAWTLGCLGGFSQSQFGPWLVPIAWWGTLFAAFVMVWSINLYNFMDGIDGLAGSQAICVTGLAGLLAAINGDLALALPCWLIAAAVGGFLLWNWPPAKVFMGDCGSGLLGFLIATLAAVGEMRGSVPLSVWVILMSVFWIDASATLLRRMVTGQPWMLPHCSHAYQEAVKAGLSHLQVTTAILLANLLLSIVAIFAMLFPQASSLLAVGSTIGILAGVESVRLAAITLQQNELICVSGEEGKPKRIAA